MSTLYNFYTDKNAKDLLRLENQKDERGKKKAKKNKNARDSSNSSVDCTKEIDNMNINNNIFNNKNKAKGFRSTFSDFKQDLNKLIQESNLQNNEKDKESCLELKKRKFNNPELSNIILIQIRIRQ